MVYIVIDLKEKVPPFMARSVGSIAAGAAIGGAVGGAIKAVAEASSGGDLLKQDNIVDPSGEVGRRVAALFAAKHGAVVDPPIFIDVDAPPAKKAEPLNGPRWGVLAVTQSWGYGPAFPNMTHYGASYGATVIIQDTSTKARFTTHCQVNAGDEEHPLDHDQLLDDGAAGFKTLLANAVQKCVEQVMVKAADLP